MGAFRARAQVRLAWTDTDMSTHLVLVAVSAPEIATALQRLAATGGIVVYKPFATLCGDFLRPRSVLESDVPVTCETCQVAGGRDAVRMAQALLGKVRKP